MMNGQKCKRVEFVLYQEWEAVDFPLILNETVFEGYSLDIPRGLTWLFSAFWSTGLCGQLEKSQIIIIN